MIQSPEHNTEHTTKQFSWPMEIATEELETFDKLQLCIVVTQDDYLLCAGSYSWIPCKPENVYLVNRSGQRIIVRSELPSGWDVEESCLGQPVPADLTMMGLHTLQPSAQSDTQC